MKEKTTSKREFAFEIKASAKFPTEYRLTIVNEAKEELRSFELIELPADMQLFCKAHGLKQKMTDDTMQSKLDKFEGDRLLACDALWARLKAGEWEGERQGVARPPEAAIIFVMEKKQIDRATAEASLKQAGKEFWDNLRKAWLKDFEAIEKRLKDQKAKASTVDLTDL